MFRHKLKTVARTVGTLALIAAGLGLGVDHARAAEEKKPVKIEFKGWFSNPIFSADGKVLIYAQMAALPYGARTGPTQLILWNVGAGKESRRIEGPADDSLLGSIVLSPDGKRLAVTLWNTALRIWDLEAGKEVSRMESSQGAQNLRFTPDGRTVGWLRSGEVFLGDPATAKLLRQFGKDDGPVTTFEFVDDGKTVIVGRSKSTDVSGAGAGKNRTLEYKLTYWALDAVNGKMLHQVGETVTETRKMFAGQPQHGLSLSADGKTVVLMGDRGSIQVCDWSTGKKIKDMPVPWKLQEGELVRKVVLSANGQVAALATAQGTISVWDLAAGKELRKIELGQTNLDHMALSPDGKALAVTYQIGGQVGAVMLIYEL
jgi:WD40 repeat protein